MFKPIRTRLLISQLVVLATILTVFAIAVRVVFARSLFHQLTEKLTALGKGVASGAEYQTGVFQPEDDTDIGIILDTDQGLQWFDLQGNLLQQQGKNILTLPLSVTKAVQVETKNQRILGVTVPVVDNDTQRLVAYVRVSQSLAEMDNTLRNLDWGLGGGVVIALVLSGIGGIWLTQQSMQPIEQSFRQLQQFTADASHELRSPIMAVKSNAAVALKYPEGMRETDAEKFQAIASAMNQMTHLTEDLLFLARTDQVFQRNWNLVNLTALLADLVQLYQPQATAKSLGFTSNLNDGLFVKGDAIHLRRLFSNLIDNALHYTNEGVIEVTAFQVAPFIDVKIRDTGIGIASEHLDRVFDRFWRADQSRTQWDGGSGLGLAIAQGIAQIHHGKVTVTSQPGAGSCFTVRLPIYSNPKRMGE